MCFIITRQEGQAEEEIGLERVTNEPFYEQNDAKQDTRGTPMVHGC